MQLKNERPVLRPWLASDLIPEAAKELLRHGFEDLMSGGCYAVWN